MYRFRSGDYNTPFTYWLYHVSGTLRMVFLSNQILPYHRLSILRNIPVYTDCNQYRQTSCYIIGAKIQTCSNLEESVDSRCHLLGFKRFLCNVSFLQHPYLCWNRRHFIGVMYSNLYILLLKDLCQPFQASEASSRTYSPGTAKRKRSASEYSTVQKDSVQCTVGASDIAGLLSSVWYSHSCVLYH